MDAVYGRHEEVGFGFGFVCASFYVAYKWVDNGDANNGMSHRSRAISSQATKVKINATTDTSAQVERHNHVISLRLRLGN